MPPASSASPPLRVLHVTPECAPLVKTGGLGDVSAALPPALRELGVDARVIMPGFPAALAAFPEAEEAGRATVLGHPVRFLQGELAGGVPLYLVECATLYERKGGPYQADDGDDWEDNALRFGVLSKAAALVGLPGSPVGWQAQVVHAHDWPSALAPLYLRHATGPAAASVVTVHNLAFQGLFPPEQFAGLEVPESAMGPEGIEFYGKYSFLKAGLVFADRITTVSPTYAVEIQGEELGCGLEGVLRKRAHVLDGVLNGIDTAVWNPLTDPHIASRYGPLTLEKKLANKLAFKRRLGLPGPSDVPLFAMVSRLTHQKGIDLVARAAERIVAMGAQLAVCGSGDADLVEALHAAEARCGGAMKVFVGFDEALAHQLEAGADVFLMPSRFEPCGMNQMYSQRYGTPPIATATGGLVDTVEDEAFLLGTGKATGFLMNRPTVEELLTAVERAIRTWKEPRAWRALQLNGMSRDFGWAPSAREYRGIYRRLHGV